jgi:hypothetical protein
MARRRPSPSSLLVRSCASVRRRAASRHRSRRDDGDERARPGAGRRRVRRHRAHRRQDGVDRDVPWLHGDAGAPWLDRGRARGFRGRGRGRRHGRPERCRRPRRAVRLLWPAHDGGRAGVRRSAGVPASAARCPGHARPSPGSLAGGGLCRDVGRAGCSASCAGRCFARGRRGVACGVRRARRLVAGGARRHAGGWAGDAGRRRAARIRARSRAAGRPACCRRTATDHAAPARAAASHRTDLAGSPPFSSPARACPAGRAEPTGSCHAGVNRADLGVGHAGVVDRRARNRVAERVRLRLARRKAARRQTYHG